MKTVRNVAEEWTDKLKTAHKKMKSKERPDQHHSEASKAPSDNPVMAPENQLPLWPDQARAVPNGVLRSALFGVIKRGARRYLDSEKMASVDGIEILYTGQRLDQGDLDVWESILHITRNEKMGDKCRSSAYSLLKLMGKTDTGANRATLHKRLLRLSANAVQIKQGKYDYAGSLIDEVYRDRESQQYMLTLNPNLLKLFASDQYTQIDWSIRHALNQKPLAQWLHGYYASHAAPFPLKIETLHYLCGCESSKMHHFKEYLASALEHVSIASKKFDQVFQYEIKDNLVFIKKSTTKSQRKHLKKANKI